MKKDKPSLITPTENLLVLLVFALTFFSCAKDPDPLPHDSIFQVSTLNALLEGDYDGRLTLENLSKEGNFGLGTFDGVDGEMVVLDNIIYQITGDGVVSTPDPSATTPFAAVKHFIEDQTFEIGQIPNFEGLHQKIDVVLKNLSSLYSVRVDATFDSITVRSVARQSKPYPPLSQVVSQQLVYNYANVKGTLVGFRLPPELAGINATGYHFHFISDDRTIGGHVLDCKAASAQVAIDLAEDLQVTWGLH